MEVVLTFVEISFHSSPIGNDRLTTSSSSSFIHSRDPHSVETLERFGQCIDHFANGKFTEKDVDEAKLATFQKVEYSIASFLQIYLRRVFSVG